MPDMYDAPIRGCLPRLYYPNPCPCPRPRAGDLINLLADIEANKKEACKPMTDRIDSGEVFGMSAKVAEEHRRTAEDILRKCFQRWFQVDALPNMPVNGELAADIARVLADAAEQAEEQVGEIMMQQATRIAELTDELCKVQGRNADLERWQKSGERSMEIIYSAAKLMKDDPENYPGSLVPDMLEDIEEAHARIAELEAERDEYARRWAAETDRAEKALGAGARWPESPTDATDRKPTL